MGPAAPGHDRLDRRVEDALDDEARQKMHDETRRGRPRDTVVATNRSSAVAFAELMIRSARPGGSMCSARHRASSTSFCRTPFSSLGQTSPASHALSRFSSARVASRTRNGPGCAPGGTPRCGP